MTPLANKWEPICLTQTRLALSNCLGRTPSYFTPFFVIMSHIVLSAWNWVRRPTKAEMERATGVPGSLYTFTTTACLRVLAGLHDKNVQDILVYVKTTHLLTQLWPKNKSSRVLQLSVSSTPSPVILIRADLSDWLAADDDWPAFAHFPWDRAPSPAASWRFESHYHHWKNILRR